MTKRVLLIEDNSDDIALARRAFRKAGLAAELNVYCSGAEALRHLLDEGDRCPDLVLLDLQLPGLDGLEVLQRLRSHDQTRRLPVVVMTSSDEAADIERSYDRGANSYLLKPVDFSDFVELVGQLDRYWLHRNRLPPCQGAAP